MLFYVHVVGLPFSTIDPAKFIAWLQGERKVKREEIRVVNSGREGMQISKPRHLKIKTL